MPIPLTPLQPLLLLLLQEDDCAPDARESFLADFPLYFGGLSLKEFKSKARCEDLDDGFATYWYLGPLILSISADDPFYSLHKASPLIASRRSTPIDYEPDAYFPWTEVKRMCEIILNHNFGHKELDSLALLIGHHPDVLNPPPQKG